MLGGAGSVVLVFCTMPKAEVGTQSRVQPLCCCYTMLFFFEFSRESGQYPSLSTNVISLSTLVNPGLGSSLIAHNNAMTACEVPRVQIFGEGHQNCYREDLVY